MKNLKFVSSLFIVLFMALLTNTSVAQTYYIKSACGKYLTVKNLGTNSGAPIVLSDFSASLAQQWKLVPRSRANGEHIFYIESVKSKKYMDVVWGKDADGTKVQLWDFTGGPAQEWTISTGQSTNPKDKSGIISQVGFKSLDKGGGPCDNNTPLMIWTRNNTAAQLWYFEEVVPNTPAPPPAKVVMEQKAAVRVTVKPNAKSLKMNGH